MVAIGHRVIQFQLGEKDARKYKLIEIETIDWRKK